MRSLAMVFGITAVLVCAACSKAETASTTRIEEAAKAAASPSVPPVQGKDSGSPSLKPDSSLGSGRSSNLLEQALDPYASTKKIYAELKDQGGLNSFNDYHGIKVVSMSTEWNSDGTLSAALLAVTKANSPKQVRDALTAGCRIREGAWKTENDDVISGEARNENVKCSYFTRSDVRSFDVLIAVSKPKK